MRRVARQMRNSVTLNEARLAACMQDKRAKRFTAELAEQRKKGKGRIYRGQSADWMTDANSRFAQIYSRSSYQARRGR